MKSLKTPILIVLSAGVLALSPSSRAQTVTNRPTKATPAAAGRSQEKMSPADFQLARIDKVVTLTEDQKPKIKAILEEREKRLQGLRTASPGERRAAVESAREDTSKKVKEILTADQYGKYQAAFLSSRQKPRGTPSQLPVNRP